MFEIVNVFGNEYEERMDCLFLHEQLTDETAKPYNVRKNEGTPVDEYLSVQQVADILHKNPDTIRAWIRAKRLIAYRLGRDYMIKREDLDKFLESRRTDQDDKDD